MELFLESVVWSADLTKGRLDPKQCSDIEEGGLTGLLTLDF